MQFSPTTRLVVTIGEKSKHRATTGVEEKFPKLLNKKKIYFIRSEDHIHKTRDQEAEGLHGHPVSRLMVKNRA